MLTGLEADAVSPTAASVQLSSIRFHLQSILISKGFNVSSNIQDNQTSSGQVHIPTGSFASSVILNLSWDLPRFTFW